METAVQNILEEYEQSILIPKEKHQPQFILAPVGLVGAGKTTVVKPLAEKFSLVRISGDDIRKILKAHHMPYDSVHEIAMALHRKYMRLGFSVVIDSDCASPETQRRIAEYEHEFRLRTLWIRINPPEDFILNKLRHYSGDQWMTADQEQLVKNYLERKPLHEHLTMPFVYSFDTSHDIEKQLAEAEVAIQDALK